jgi:hypothetical protein
MIDPSVVKPSKVGRSWEEITDCRAKQNRRDLEWVSKLAGSVERAERLNPF